MGLVNHTISNLTGGVTQVFDEQVNEIQVREMINCMPSLTKGVLRRNPVNGVTLTGPFNTNDYFTYSYDKGVEGEQYLFLIGNGEWLIFNANTGGFLTRGTSTYLNLPFGVSPKDAFSLTTVKDFTFIVNKYVKVALSSTVDGVIDSHKKTGVYLIKQTSPGIVRTETRTIVDDWADGVLVPTITYTANIREGFTYNLNGKKATSTISDDRVLPINQYNSEAIINKLASLQTGITIAKNESFLWCLNLPNNYNWYYSDTNGDLASFAFNGIVERPDMLPAKLPYQLNNTLINISNSTTDKNDDYWLIYKDSTWIESRKPGMKNTIAANTMPHVFTRGSTGLFSFSEYTESALNVLGFTNPSNPYGWKTRQYGDEISSPVPSFVDNYLTSIFFHKNRLGVTSKDNIILSENNDFGNFWNTTVRSVPDTDPIDITIATTDTNHINYVVPNNSTLILFSNTAQFILHSGNQPLTPSTATLDVASKYLSSTKVSPQTIGNKVYFISESVGYSNLYLFNFTEGNIITEALNLSRDIPTYIPKNIILIEGDSSSGYLFMLSSDNKKELYIYNQHISNNKMEQSAFHKWTFAKDIIGLNIIKNKLIITFIDNTNIVYAGNISLEIPANINDIVYTDTLDITTTNYESSISFSKWFIKDANNNGSKLGRLQIRSLTYTINSNSKYSTYIVDSSGTISTTVIAWSDTNTWADTATWIDGILYPTFRKDNYEKVSVLSDSKNTDITFKNDTNNPSKGFQLATITYEGFYYAASQRI